LYITEKKNVQPAGESQGGGEALDIEKGQVKLFYEDKEEKMAAK